jgi:hypothetical protein
VRQPGELLRVQVVAGVVDDEQQAALFGGCGGVNPIRASGGIIAGGGSPFGATARFEIGECLVSHRIQAPRRCVVFDLAIPRLCVELGKPRPERGELSRREL